MKLFLCSLLLSLTFEISAQDSFTKNLDPVIKEEFNKIRKLGSDTVIIYEQFCVGCQMLYHIKPGEKVPEPCVYERFIRGKIYWKLNNRYYSKQIACVSEADTEAVETSDEIFEYFFSNLDRFESIDRYTVNGIFLPPIPEHTSYEQLSVYTPKINHQILLAEQQKDSVIWGTYEWIPPTIEIMEKVEKTFSEF